MQNPTVRTRSGLLWNLISLVAGWCAATTATATAISANSAGDSFVVVAAQPSAQLTSIGVANSQSAAPYTATIEGAVVHAIPTLDGFGLFVLAALLGLAVLWLWRRRE